MKTKSKKIGTKTGKSKAKATKKQTPPRKAVAPPKAPAEPKSPAKPGERTAVDAFHEARARGRSPAQIRALACARGDKDLRTIAEDAMAGKTIPTPTPKPVSEEKPPKREFTIRTTAGDDIRVEYNPGFNHHLVYHGPVSETGFRSDFSFTGEGSPEEYARKMADEWQVELAKKRAKGRGKSGAAATGTAKPAAGESPAPVRAKPTGDEPKKERVSALNLAAALLRESGKPMTTGEMMTAILAQGNWTTNGRTPGATLYSAILREIQKKGADARFKKVDRGRFAANA